jgi:site-specific recombinase XerD
MSNTKIILRTKNQTKTGMHPLYLRFYKNRRYAYKSLNITCRIDQFDVVKEQLNNKYEDYKRYNHIIIQKKLELDQKLLANEGLPGSIHMFKKSIEPEAINLSFYNYFEEYITTVENKKSYGTLRKVKSVFKKLKDYNKKSDFTFEEFNVTFLKKYIDYLRSIGNSENTIHANTKIFKKLINDAIREDLIDMSSNPFLKVKIARENTRIDFLFEDELNKLVDLDLVPFSFLDNVRDLFLFAAKGGGVRISDLLKLKAADYNDGRISFFINKTKNQHSISLPVQAQSIIEKYLNMDNSTGYVFPFLKAIEIGDDSKILAKKIGSVSAMINAELKNLAKMAGINKKLTFHVARHSFASLALRHGIPISYVSNILGHSNITQTMVYAKIVPTDQDSYMKNLNF